MPAKKENKSFEQSLERLEKIVDEMERGNLPLDDMIARFEEGQGLLKVCRKKLNEVQKKVEVLVKKEGSVVLEDFDEEDEEASLF
jgi:exodeoxyribonuclease VII small subunit